MNLSQGLAQLVQSGNVFFLIWGAVMVFSMHAGFAFLEAGSVRKKNVVNAFTKILSDWSVSTVVYFFIGFPLAYGITFLTPISQLLGDQGFNLAHFFFLLTFAACIPAIISGGIAERAQFGTQIIAGAIFVGLIYPLYEALVWGRFGIIGGVSGWLANFAGVPFHDFAGSVVVHAMGGWLALPAILILGPRLGRYLKGKSMPLPLHSIPYLSLGTWLLMIGWFGFNVASAGVMTRVSGLVAVNSLLAMVGGALAALVFSKNDSVFIHNGALAGLIAVCAGSDIFHPVAALIVGIIAGIIFTKCFVIETEVFKIDDVLGVWPLHGIAGAWGGIAAGIFGYEFLGGAGGVSIVSQLIGVGACLVIALIAGTIVYKFLDAISGIRLSKRDEMLGSDLAVHRVKAYPEELL
ncbi:MAG: ammonium transporter [Candidatus Margulisbacteria bacterium]|nr:ammonium transporter [Candidatus Margulisiibacteriota bacterium]MBU1021298.1 ammonium transporter [Candidatus Margulisiibacteriota bacterium]MBU1729213.1 ammonium transporter [Candidatus Margulisiibacteriota bacterium]MBU1954886.1 ammonium transporter [Candidatus Margulisiibacteriota bacterium]